MIQPALSETSFYPRNIKQAWNEYRYHNSKARTRDVAKALNVSEAELLAIDCGANVVRLAATWLHLVKLLEELGPVRVLTRNDHAIHEKFGRYRIIRFSGNNVLVQGNNIDLRLDLSHWHSSFAVKEDNYVDLTRYSLQFFDIDGSSVHTVYLTKDSDLDAYHSLVSAFKAPDQSSDQFVQASPWSTERSDDDIDAHRLRERWRMLKDPHSLDDLLSEFGVSRIHALQLVGSEFATRISPNLFRGFMEAVAAIELSVVVSVKTKGVVQIHSGSIEVPRDSGYWLHILGDDFSLRVNEKAIASLWVVNFPVVGSTHTSMELYDTQGKNIALVFGPSKPVGEDNSLWHNLITSLPGAECL